MMETAKRAEDDLKIFLCIRDKLNEISHPDGREMQKENLRSFRRLEMW